MPIFSVKKGTFFLSLQQTRLLCTGAYDGISITKDNPLCVAPHVGYYALFFATDCEASQCKDSISFVLPEANTRKIRIRVITTNNIHFRMRGLALHFEICAEGILSGMEMRGLAIMEQKTIKWTDPPTTQHVHSLDAALLHGRPYRSRRHLQFSYCGHHWLHCPTAMVGGLELGTADVINKRNVGPVDRYQEPKMRTCGGFARKDRYARVACAAICWQEYLFNCSVKEAIFLWNCRIKCTFLIL